VNSLESLDAIRADPETAARLTRLDAVLEHIPVQDASAERLLTWVVEVNRSIGIPAPLAETGVIYEQLSRIAELALSSKRLVTIAPVEPNLEQVHQIVKNACKWVICG
jgi:alcohol dehydrogenase class IV